MFELLLVKPNIGKKELNVKKKKQLAVTLQFRFDWIVTKALRFLPLDFTLGFPLDLIDRNIFFCYVLICVKLELILLVVNHEKVMIRIYVGLIFEQEMR